MWRCRRRLGYYDLAVRLVRRADGRPRPSARLVSVVTVGSIALWLTRSFWLPGHYVVGFDTFAYSGPNARVTSTAIRAGRLPLLNDTIFGTVTHLGNPQSGVLYPPRLLVAAMEENRALGLIVAAHVVLLGLGMRAFLRRMGASELASGFGSLVLIGSGVVMTKSIQFEQILVVAWIPIILLVIHRVSTESRPAREAALLALCTAAAVSAGHPQLTYELVVMAGVFAVAVSIRRRWRRLGWMMGSAVGGFLIVLPQMWASLVAIRDSPLADGRDISALGSRDFVISIRSAALSLLGTIRSTNPGAFVGAAETVGFLGVSVVILAVLGAGSAYRSRRDRPWLPVLVGLGALALVFSLGPRTPVFDLAFRFLPGFDLARVSARWLVVVAIASSTLAAFGLDRLRTRTSRSDLIGIALFMCAGFAYLATLARRPDTITLVTWIVTANIAVGIIILARTRPRAAARAAVALAVAEVLTFSMSSFPQQIREEQPYTSARSDITTWLAGRDGYTVALTADFDVLPDVILGLRPNANTLLDIRSIDGYDGGVQITERWARALHRFSPSPNSDLPLRNSLVPPIDTEVAARTNIRFLLVDRTRFDEDAAAGWGTPILSERNLDLYENPAWLSEAIAWPTARMLPLNDINPRLRDGLGDDTVIAFVDRPLEAVPSTCAAPCTPLGLSSERHSPERITVRAVLDAPSLVSFPVQAMSGWRVEVDGRPARIAELDALYLGVEVPAGTHEIVFEYRPRWLVPTVSIAVLATLATLGLLVVERRRARQSA